jgi:hypothetical protein
MNSVAGSLLVVVALSLVAGLLKHYFGSAAKVAFAAVVVLSAIGLSILCSVQRARLSRRLRRMSPDEVARYLDECRKAGIEIPLEEMSRPQLSWTGKVLDALLGVTAAFGPPLVCHLACGRPMTWSAEFTGWHLVCMGIGVALYLSVRRMVIRPFVRNPGRGDDGGS